MSYTAWSREVAMPILDKACTEAGPVLVCLQAMQGEFGYVHPEAVEMIAKVCNVSRAEVHGVLTFYHDLRTEPAPAIQVRICVAEACQSVGSRQLVAEVEKVFGVQIDSADEQVEVTAVYCLGNCALGPSAVVNGELVGRATAQGLRKKVNS